MIQLYGSHLADRDWLTGDRLMIADLAAAPYLALMGGCGHRRRCLAEGVR